MLQQLVFILALVAELALLSGHPGVQGKGESVSSLVPDRGTAVDTNSNSNTLNNVRQKRAPGWGKRGGDFDGFKSDSSSDLLDSAVHDESETEKRAPGWGKREFAMDKRAPGWGKRAPGWGKRAPGWGKRAPGWGKRSGFLSEAEEKRAPGWGKRAPGWGKRAPGWGKRSGFLSESEEKRAPGWGKRAPGWGKRAPGWGKRAPGWGKRSLGVETDVCQVLRAERDLYMSRVVEAEAEIHICAGSD
ncbi:cerebral peptide 1-like [Littorina saxatilis]|uniref:cerebral peptide 1-like n=1 Tax=Littorina saxatilis TaxID=31220 RepID=UPI0038B4AACB